jgi:antitoxin (DNA-binding transcriptional repressor) of toxin-antitoxin stability system
MIRVGIKEAKNNLSDLLRRVTSGEEVILTKRGKPIARIAKDNGNHKPARDVLLPLAQEGIAVLPSRELRKSDLTPVKVAGKSVSEMVIEDRR